LRWSGLIVKTSRGHGPADGRRTVGDGACALLLGAVDTILLLWGGSTEAQPGRAHPVRSAAPVPRAPRAPPGLVIPTCLISPLAHLLNLLLLIRRQLLGSNVFVHGHPQNFTPQTCWLARR
jgi:hypothetical protein